MDIDKRNAIRRILSGQDELPVVLNTDDMGIEHDGEVIHYVPDKIDDPKNQGYNETNQRRNMTQENSAPQEHSHEAPSLNFEQIATRFQQRLGEVTMRYEADLIVQAQQYEAQIQALAAENAELREAAEKKAPKK